MSKTRRTPAKGFWRPKSTRLGCTQRGIHAVVHWRCIWINGDAISNLSNPALRRLVKMLLDNGIEVRGYWRDVDYKRIDPRISSENGRV
jgi:hypothetical protein